MPIMTISKLADIDAENNAVNVEENNAVNVEENNAVNVEENNAVNVEENNAENDGINCVADYVEVIAKLVNKIYTENNHSKKVLFRGENQHFELFCVPNSFRDTDREAVYKEYKTYNRIKSYRHINDNSPYLHVAIEAQHGGLISRLLDLTENALIALFFSLVDGGGNLYKENCDAYVYIFVASEILDCCDPEVCEKYEELIRKSSDAGNVNDEEYKDVYYIGSSELNKRIMKQQGWFALFCNYSTEIVESNVPYRIKIKKEVKNDLYDELIKFFGIDKYYIYPEITNLSDTVKKEIKYFGIFEQQ